MPRVKPLFAAFLIFSGKTAVPRPASHANHEIVLHENPYDSIYGRKDSKRHRKRLVSLFIVDQGQPQKTKKHHKNPGGITNVRLHQIPLLN